MSIKTSLAQRLRKYPALYRLAAKVYFALQPYHLLGMLIGTKAQEQRWARRSIAAGYWQNREHPSKRFLVDRIAAYAPFASVLEAGCASGPSLYLLAKRFPRAEITGIDINAAAVEYGNRQFTREGITNVKLLADKADRLGRFPDKSFDIVFTNALLIYIGPDKIERVMEDMLRLSRKALVLMECHAFEPGRDATGRGFSQDGNWIRDYAALLKRLVPEKSLRISRIPEEVWPVEPWRSFGAVIEVVR